MNKFPSGQPWFFGTSYSWLRTISPPTGMCLGKLLEPRNYLPSLTIGMYLIAFSSSLRIQGFLYVINSSLSIETRSWFRRDHMDNNLIRPYIETGRYVKESINVVVRILEFIQSVLWWNDEFSNIYFDWLRNTLTIRPQSKNLLICLKAVLSKLYWVV